MILIIIEHEYYDIVIELFMPDIIVQILNFWVLRYFKNLWGNYIPEKRREKSGDAEGVYAPL